MDRKALDEVIARRDTIASVGDASRRRVRQLTLPLAAGDDGAALMGALPSQEDVEAAADALQRERMEAIGGDAGARAGELDPGTVGTFDGDLWLSGALLRSGERAEIARVFRHERKHREDGTRPREIDRPLLPQTGIPEIDAELPETTERDVLEKGAMQAEGGAPRGSYVEEHWKPATELERGFDAAGEDGAGALAALQRNDLPTFERARTRLFLHAMAAGEDSP